MMMACQQTACKNLCVLALIVITLFSHGICSVPCSAIKNFEIILERAELTDMDPEIMRGTAIINKYNRTCKAFSMNFNILKNLTDVMVEIQGFALYSNEYRPTPVKFKRNICDLFKYEYLWFKSELVKTSNLPTQCPFPAGDYYVKDFVPNGAGIPAVANFPWTNVVVCLRFLYRDKVFATINIYLTFDHDVELKRVG